MGWLSAPSQTIPGIFSVTVTVVDPQLLPHLAEGELEVFEVLFGGVVFQSIMRDSPAPVYTSAKTFSEVTKLENTRNESMIILFIDYLI
ncbi:TPA: hypothetical protein DCZ36_01725 [Candidatus Gracilibacteria bacterium]|nr:hypothetical protein [Candidatus Gracilibacteria bacterium]